MPKVYIPNRNAFEHCLRRFKRSCEKAGIGTKLRQCEHYEKPAAKRKREKAAAKKRHLKRLMRMREASERDRTRY